MSSRTYLLRLIIPFTLMMIAIVILSGFLIYNSGLATARQQQIEEMQGNAGHLAYILSQQQTITDPAFLKILEVEAQHRRIRYSLIDEAGKVFFDTEVKIADLNNHNDRPEITQSRQSGEGYSVRPSVSQGVVNIYYAQRVKNHPGLIARASRVLKPPLEVSGRMIAQLAGAIVLSILIVTWLAITLQNRWISPVHKLAEATDKMAAGEWGTRVKISDSSALKSFSERLNFLAEQAQKQLRDLEQQRTELALLVDSLPDPIILTNANHRVILLNEPAAKFLQLTSEQAKGQKFFSILGEPRLLDLYEQIISPGTDPGITHMREIRALRNNQRFTFQAVVVRMTSGGVVMVLRDITRLAAAIQMKTDFVANASHELRTPLAAIKLAFDTLQEVHHEDPEQTARCIEIINGHLKRLEDMIADLLDLSKVENAEFKAELTELRASDLIAIVRNTMGPFARAKQIDLTLDFDPELHFHSDRLLMDLILKNLVENSIKYTPAGGKVSLKMTRGVDQTSPIMIYVKDTGIGIPPQHLERVFERFYQVDAARTGSAGRGTGLGLAIVKHAVNTLNGQIHVDSTVGIGTNVTCTIPEGMKHA